MSYTTIENHVADGQWMDKTIIHHGASESTVVFDSKQQSTSVHRKPVQLFKHIEPKGV